MRGRDARTRRRGLTSVAVLVCLVIITLISGALLKLGVAHRGQARAQERRLQAEWLAQAGLGRALARLAARPDYPGESWKIAAADLGLSPGSSADPGPAAVVAIVVERPGGSSGQRLIKVQADFPPDPPRRSRHSLQMLVDLGPQKTGASR
ncbi:MAG: hypothetical protein U0790_20135 [Isosphaeraceae bacterium]